MWPTNSTFAERFTYLDTMSGYSRQGAASLAGFAAPEIAETDPDFKRLKGTIDSLIRYSANAWIDWDYVLRMGNWWFDRIAYAYRQPTRAEQREALAKLDEEIRKLRKTAEDAKSLDEAMRNNPNTAFSVRFNEVLLTLFLPQITSNVQVEDRWIMRFELDKLGFALASYHADHGAYPAKLANLAPDCVAELPKDIFNDSELHYRLEGKGYVLYSVGVNRKDDGAKSYKDHKKGEDWDDLVIRVPAPEQK